MDLNHLESMWNAYDAKLDKHLKLNETLLRKLNLDKSRKELQKQLRGEILTIGLTGLFLIYLLVLSILLWKQAKFSIPTFIGFGAASGLVGIALMRIHKLKHMNFYGHSVLELQERLYAFMQFRIRKHWIEMILGFVLLLVMWPVILFTGFEIDLYQQPGLWIGIILVCILISIPIALMHERAYRQSLEHARLLLEEIKELSA